MFFVSSGINYKFNSTISAGADFAWREKVSDSGAEKLQLTAFNSQKFSKNWGCKSTLSKGLVEVLLTGRVFQLVMDSIFKIFFVKVSSQNHQSVVSHLMDGSSMV